MRTAFPHPPWLASVFLLLLFTSHAYGGELLVAAPAAFEPAGERLASEYFRIHGKPVTMVFGAMAVLTTQAIHGAPFDLILSTGRSWTQRLTERNLLEQESIRTLSVGRMALLVRPPTPLPPGIPLLDAREIRRLSESTRGLIAFAHPDYSPDGLLAMEILEKAGLTHSIRGRLLHGEDSRHAMALLKNGNASLALVPESLARISKTPWLGIRPNLHSRFELVRATGQPSGRHPDLPLFLKLLESPITDNILRDFGFTRRTLDN